MMPLPPFAYVASRCSASAPPLQPRRPWHVILSDLFVADGVVARTTLQINATRLHVLVALVALWQDEGGPVPVPSIKSFDDCVSDAVAWLVRDIAREDRPLIYLAVAASLYRAPRNECHDCAASDASIYGLPNAAHLMPRTLCAPCWELEIDAFLGVAGGSR